MNKIFFVAFMTTIAQNSLKASQVLVKQDAYVLTTQDNECFSWFEQQRVALGFNFKTLSVEDQNILVNKKLSYQENPGAVTRAVNHCAEAFCKQLADNGLEQKYDAAFLSAVLLKLKIKLQECEKSGQFVPTDELSARIYVFKTKLSPQEQATVLRDNYLKDPEATYAAMAHAGEFLAVELVKLGLIADTDEAKVKAAQEYSKKKIEDLKATYGK